jgi:hypothetical protein
MTASPTERSWCVLEFVKVSWQFNACGAHIERIEGHYDTANIPLIKWWKHNVFQFGVCGNMVLQDTPIIYMHPV